MKKVTLILIIILVLATFALPVIAEKEGVGVHAGITIEAARTQTPSATEQEKKHGADDTVTVTNTTRETIEAEHGKQSQAGDSQNKTGRNISDIRDDNNKSHEALNATLRNVSSDQRDRIKNENEVRIAVHTLLETEGLSGGIGRNVSAIARDFNNSGISTRKLEDRIQSRSSIERFLFGGDRDAAWELANQTAQNKARIAGLQQLINSADLDPDVRAMMEDQVVILQKEQDRLEQLSKREQADRGLFGWLG